MSIRRRKRWTIVCLTVLTASCARLPPEPQLPDTMAGRYDAVAEKLRWRMRKVLQEREIPGMAVALVVDGKVQVHEGVGIADRRTKEPVTADSRFRLGSLAKVIGAILALEAVDAGQLDLNAPLPATLLGTHWQPKLRDNREATVTLAQLLSHQSGLPSDLIHQMWTSSPAHFSKSFDYLRQQYFAAEPGVEFRYSNLAYNVAAAHIASVQKKEYRLLSTELLQKLGMRTAKISADPGTVVRGYRDRRELPELGLRDVPAAGLSGSVRDLSKLLHFLLDPKPSILAADVRDQLFANRVADHPINGDRRYGLGLYHYRAPFAGDTLTVGHTGAAIGHRSLIKLVPEYGLGVALACNAEYCGGALHGIADEALALAFHAHFGRRAPLRARAWPTTQPADQMAHAAMARRFATAAGLVEIQDQGSEKALQAKLGGRKLRLSRREGKGLYYPELRLFGLWSIHLGSFSWLGFSTREIDGRAALISANTLNERYVVGREVDPTPLSTAWQSRLGRYRIETPIPLMAIPSGGLKEDRGLLIAFAKTETGDRLEVVLKPLNDQEAQIAGYGRGLGETVFVRRDQKGEYLSYSNLVFRRLTR